MTDWQIWYMYGTECVSKAGDEVTSWTSEKSWFDSWQREMIYLFTETYQTGCQVHPASHSMSTAGYFPTGKAAGATHPYALMACTRDIFTCTFYDCIGMCNVLLNGKHFRHTTVRSQKLVQWFVPTFL